MNASSPRHLAVVLAAGGSRRLGQPKQLLKREGETLVHRAVRMALATQPARVLLVVGGDADAVRAAVAGLDVEITVNTAWEEGLASSVRMAAIALADSQAPCLLLGCDQPALQVSHLQQLLEGAAVSESACAATMHGDAMGIPVVVSPAVLAEARALVGDRGLRAVLQGLPRESIHVLDARELQFDLDTPADMQTAIERGWLDQPT
jgi:molybdenum cofactor cytidylyltransferase